MSKRPLYTPPRKVTFRTAAALLGTSFGLVLLTGATPLTAHAYLSGGAYVLAALSAFIMLLSAKTKL